MNAIKHLTNSSLLLIVVLLIGCSKTETPEPKEKKASICSIKGTIVSLDCVGSHLGIVDEENNYYYVEKDLTNSFSKYKDGDKICFEFKTCDRETEFNANTGIMATPATSIHLTCLSDCGCNDDCKKVVAVRELPNDSTPNQLLNIHEMRQDGNMLYMKLAFSGCDMDIDPDLLVSPDNKSQGSIQIYNCFLRENRVQLCQAYFIKEFCFDLTSLSENSQKYKLVFQTSSETKSITIEY